MKTAFGGEISTETYSLLVRNDRLPNVSPFLAVKRALNQYKNVTLLRSAWCGSSEYMRRRSDLKRRNSFEPATAFGRDLVLTFFISFVYLLRWCYRWTFLFAIPSFVRVSFILIFCVSSERRYIIRLVVATSSAPSGMPVSSLKRRELSWVSWLHEKVTEWEGCRIFIRNANGRKGQTRLCCARFYINEQTGEKKNAALPQKMKENDTGAERRRWKKINQLLIGPTLTLKTFF